MTTYRYSINPEDPVESIVGATGAATVTKNIELTINQAALIRDGSSPTNPRGIKKSEVLLAIDKLKQFILKDTSGGFL
jgi:hypothetical protein